MATSDDFDPFGLYKESNDDSNLNSTYDFTADFHSNQDIFGSSEDINLTGLEAPNSQSFFDKSFDTFDNLKPDESCPISAKIALHEHMSCAYDETSTPMELSVDGVLSVEPPTDVECKPFYLVMKDPKNHLKNVTSYFECVTEVTHGDFVKHLEIHKTQGNRIFRVSVPLMEDGDEKSIHVIKYTCTDALKPVPLVSYIFYFIK